MQEFNKNVEIVIARYNEDLSWINDFPFNQFEYIIYNKGDNENFVKNNIKKIITLPNVGMCDHTYLYHIVNNYNSLANITVFLPGSVYLPNKINIAKSILNNILNSNFENAYFIGTYYDSVKNKFNNFTLDYHKCECMENNIKNDDTKLLNCKIRPYGKWYDYFFGNTPAHWVAMDGVFSVDKKDIIQHPIERYNKLLHTINIHYNHEGSHYIERSWGVIFFPMLYTIKINSSDGISTI